MELSCKDCARFLQEDGRIERNQGKIRWVLAINLAMMLGEIVSGYLTGSMALLADGWHMASHAGALFITLLAYRLARSQKLSKSFSFGTGKLIPLGGYTSAIALGIVALLVLIESIGRLIVPEAIVFNQAIGVACLGLVVNSVSALILHDDLPHGHSHGHDHDHDHDHEHDHVHDHNLRSAFLHVIADAVTSFLAIFALLAAKYYHQAWLDPAMGIVGAGVIFSWSFQLCRDTGWELLDGHSKTVDWAKLREAIEGEGARVLDFHVWRIAPQAVACELVVAREAALGPDHYRHLLRDKFRIQHVIVEERLHSPS